MKLEFQEESLKHYRPVFTDTKVMEDTAEAIIPDACPDASEVLYCSGMAFLRGKELREGTAEVSVGVSAMALVQPEGRVEPEIVEVYIPMSVRIENSALRDGMQLRAEVSLRRLDSHLLNSRKISVRAAAAVTICCYSEEEEPFSVGAANPGVEVLCETVPVCCLTSMGEKTYTAEDTLRLSPDGTVKKLAGVTAAVRHPDFRLTGTRAILKGEAELKLLYLDGDNRMQTGLAVLPFSQYIDLGDCDEHDDLRLTTEVMGADVEPSADASGINVSMKLMTCAQVWSRKEIRFISDLYALKGQTDCQRRKTNIVSLLDRQQFLPSVHGTVPVESTQVIDTFSIPGEIRSSRNGEQVTLTAPVSVHVLMRDDSGALQGGNCRVELECSTRACAECEVAGEIISLECGGNGGVGQTDLKLTGNMQVETLRDMEIDQICGGELSEESEPTPRPSVVIRRAGEGERLWDLARDCCSTTDTIARVNGLTGEPEPGQMLLIPVL